MKHTQQSRSTRRLGEREVESDDALAEAALIVEQGGNDEKNQRAKSTAGTKGKKSMANSSQRRIKRAYTQQQGKSRTYHNSREIKEHRQPQAETVTQRKKSNS